MPQQIESWMFSGYKAECGNLDSQREKAERAFPGIVKSWIVRSRVARPGKAGSVFLFYALFSVVFGAFPLYAEPELKTATSLQLMASSQPAGKFVLTHSYILPFLSGDHALTEDNNIQFDISAGLTPISTELTGEAVLTPVAFFQIAAGGMLSSGWNIESSGSQIRGIGINRRAQDGSTRADGSAFDGVTGEGYLGGALQFDLAGIIPGDWHHLVFRSYHQIGYTAYSRAAKGESWFYENDFGENQNGWNYCGNYLLGFRMPIFVDTVALLAEMKKYLYDTPGGSQWGDALGRWEFSAVTGFTISEDFTTMLAIQFRTLRRYSNYSYGDEYELYYRDRILADGNSRQIAFYRAAVILRYRLHSTKQIQ